MFCVKCGTETIQGGAFCSKCGQPVAATVVEIPMKEAAHVDANYQMRCANNRRRGLKLILAPFIVLLGILFLYAIATFVVNSVGGQSAESNTIGSVIRAFMGLIGLGAVMSIFICVPLGIVSMCKSESRETVDVSGNSAPGYAVATTGQRLANHLIDFIVFLVCICLIAIISTAALNEQARDAVAFFAIYFGFIVYYLVFESVWQRTPGKWLTGTKVVLTNGERPKFIQILGRTVARYIPFDALSYLANPVGWHDSLSGTLVVPTKYSVEDVRKIDHGSKKNGSLVVAIVVGFFLIIAMIGLMSTLAVVALNSARAKSRDSKRVADIKQIQTALELYYADNDGYPVDSLYLGGYDGTSSNVLSSSGFSSLAGSSGQTYMAEVPKAATPADGKCTEEQNNYYYLSSDDTGYQLGFCLGDVVGDLSAGTHIATPNGIE